jgi:hypothetical protein
MITMALVSLGWIFFRANSWSQARQMLLAVGSPGSYDSHVLSSSLYLLVMTLGVGYGLVVLIADTIKERIDTPSKTGLAGVGQRHWFWIAPLYALAMIFVLMITSTQGGGVGQFMYRGF